MVPHPVPHPGLHNLSGMAGPKFHALAPGEVRCRARNFHPIPPYSENYKRAMSGLKLARWVKRIPG